MKPVILGFLGTAIVIYTVVSCVAVYSISSRRNEMENCLASVLKQNMDAYFVRQVPEWENSTEGAAVTWEVAYVPDRKCSDEQVKAYVEQDIAAQLRSDSEVTVSVFACDMEIGILSVGVAEQFFLPNGSKKTLRHSKTLVVEEELPETASIRMRFISRKYFEDAAGGLVARSGGGLDAASRWATDFSLRSLLRQTLASAE